MKTYTSLFNIIVIGLAMVLMATTCDDDCNGYELHDGVLYSLNISPEKRTYKVNDTISLETNFSSFFNLLSSDTTYDNSLQEVEGQIWIFRIEANNQASYTTADSFDAFSIHGEVNQTYKNNFDRIRFSNICSSNECELSVHLVPKKSGFYMVQLKNGTAGNYKLCENIYLSRERIIVQDNNFSILETINTTELNLNNQNYPNPEQDETLYFFKVVE